MFTYKSNDDCRLIDFFKKITKHAPNHWFIHKGIICIFIIAFLQILYAYSCFWLVRKRGRVRTVQYSVWTGLDHAMVGLGISPALSMNSVFGPISVWIGWTGGPAHAHWLMTRVFFCTPRSPSLVYHVSLSSLGSLALSADSFSSQSSALTPHAESTVGSLLLSLPTVHALFRRSDLHWHHSLLVPCCLPALLVCPTALTLDFGVWSLPSPATNPRPVSEAEKPVKPQVWKCIIYCYSYLIFV